MSAPISKRVKNAKPCPHRLQIGASGKENAWILTSPGIFHFYNRKIFLLLTRIHVECRQMFLEDHLILLGGGLLFGFATFVNDRLQNTEIKI